MEIHNIKITSKTDDCKDFVILATGDAEACLHSLVDLLNEGAPIDLKGRFLDIIGCSCPQAEDVGGE